MDAIRRARYHWFSHGHPDHLNIDALPMLTAGQFLLSDHYGKRIYNDLVGAGHNVRILRDRVWEQLSPRVKVCSFANAIAGRTRHGAGVAAHCAFGAATKKATPW